MLIHYGMVMTGKQFSVEEVREIVEIALELGKEIPGYERFGYGNAEKLLGKMVPYRDVFEGFLKKESKANPTFGKYNLKIPDTV
jgi:hypothetical protein